MRLIDADYILKHIPPEEMCSRMVVANAPTIEPERKKGVWLNDDGEIQTDGYCATCSVCGVMSEYLTAYCGNCGAKMEGKQNETDRC